jgi:thiamine-monophosphate kinase
MAGEPWAAVISVAAPPATPTATVEGFYDGVETLASRSGLAVVGGDVVASRAGLFFAMAALGLTLKGAPPLSRSGARAGDLLLLTGEMGAARAGLDILRGSAAGEGKDAAVARYRRPTPRLAFGRLLAERALASAAIDTSDSLAEAAGHLARASGVGVEVQAAALPIAVAAREVAANLGVDPLAYAVGAGEDFELLVAVPAARIAEAETAAAAATPARVIGRVTAEPGVLTLVAGGERKPLAATPFSHF